MVEIFSGSCRLTASLRSLGFDAWGVDHSGRKLAAVSPAYVELDLTLDKDVEKLFKLLEHPLLIFAHMSPPSDTANRARDVSIQGGPLPLRSAAFPLGLPALGERHPRDIARVEAANKLYAVCARVALLLTEKSIPWSIGCPHNSYFWDFPAISALLGLPGVSDVLFASCMWGGKRPKVSRWRSFPPGLFEPLGMLCDGQHAHEPWGRDRNRFATAAEAAYPEGLCQAIANLLSGFLGFAPVAPLPVLLEKRQPLSKHAVADHRVAAGVQPRGHRFPRLLPEFKEVHTIECDLDPADPSVVPGYVWQSTTLQNQHIPDRAKTIRTKWLGGGGCEGSSDAPRRPPTRGCIRHFAGEALPQDHVYIGRTFRTREGRIFPGSKWANPFPLSSCSSLDSCIQKFRAYFLGSGLPQDLLELEGMVLLCHCGEHAQCHGDVIIGEFVSRFARQKSKAVLYVGVFATPEEFVSAAGDLQHPFDRIVAPADYLKCVELKASRPAAVTVRARMATLAKWQKREVELRDQEDRLHAALDPRVAGVLKGKKILLLRDMLREIGFPEVDALIHLFSSGFPLVGPFPHTGSFPSADRAATVRTEDLWRGSRAFRMHLLKTVRGSGDADLDAAVYEATRKEVESGTLSGPHDAADLDACLGCWLPARRFGVRQGQQVRPVDDFSEGGVNAAFEASETVAPADLDHIAAGVRAHMAAFQGDKGAGLCHPDYKDRKLVGRMWDLKKAYRQIAVAPRDQSFAVIAVWNPEAKCVEWYRMAGMPFGASSSVLGFNWIAFALCCVLVQIFTVAASNFYDDFTVVEFPALACSTEFIVDAVFQLLGWTVKELASFSDQPAPLGAVLDLRGCPSGVALLANREQRVREITQDIDAVLSAGSASPVELRRLRGRLVHARAQAFGRFGAGAFRALSCLAEGRGHGRALPDEFVFALRALRTHLQAARPREVRARYPLPPLLFTDGACEQVGGSTVVTIGGVLLLPADRTMLYFSGTVPPALVQTWEADGSRQVIAEGELFPQLVARLIWADHLRSTSCLSFIDNDSSRAMLVRGYSTNVHCAALVEAVIAEDAALGLAAWFERVPSHSNIADAPSRCKAPARLSGWAAPALVDTESVVRCTAQALLK